MKDLTYRYPKYRDILPFFKGHKNIYSITAKIVQALISAKQNSKWLLAAVTSGFISPSGKVFEV